MEEVRRLSAPGGAKSLSDLIPSVEAIVMVSKKPVDGVLIEELSDQFMGFLAEEAARKKLPPTIGLKEPLYVAYQSLIDVCVDLLRETGQVDYLKTCEAVVDVIAPIKKSTGNAQMSRRLLNPAFEDNRNYRDFLRAKVLVFIRKSTNAHLDDAVFVLTALRTGLQGMM